MTENSKFFSTPKLVSDLLFISDLLKQIEMGERSYFLKEIISKLNKNLPANVYIPIQTSSIHEFAHCLKDDQKRIAKKFKEKTGIVHKVLGLSTDYAFCLHSKERVPYHVILKVVFTFDPNPNKPKVKQSSMKLKQSPR